MGVIDELVASGAKVGEMLVPFIMLVPELLLVLLLVVLLLLLFVAIMVGLMDGPTVMLELLKVLVDTDALALRLVGTIVKFAIRAVGANVGRVEPLLVPVVGDMVFLFKPDGKSDDFIGALVGEVGALVTPPGIMVGFGAVVGVTAGIIVIPPVPLKLVGAVVTPTARAKAAFEINMDRIIERSML